MEPAAPTCQHRAARGARRQALGRKALLFAIALGAAAALSFVARSAYAFVAEGPDTATPYNEAAYMAGESLLAGGDR